ncbi:hypothetical protein FV226_14525 [Methylobacterium sp. WL12]|nr:hypothetical protein FV226_14525 [Methylobacterium sp. WL12]
MVDLMNSEFDGSVETDQTGRLERLRTSLTTWAAFALLLTFLVVTIALWGYAAWALMNLMELFA